MQVNLSADKKRNVELNIVNATGKLITNKKLLLSEAIQTVLPNVQSGNYFVRIEYEGQITTKKFIIE